MSDLVEIETDNYSTVVLNVLLDCLVFCHCIKIFGSINFLNHN